MWDCAFGFVEPPATLAVPSPKFQVKEYGELPPEAVAVKLILAPATPDDGPVIATVNSGGDTVRDWVAFAV